MSTILIVDSHPNDRRVYTTLLGNFGHRLLEANDGAQALDLARTELPDLIITDILMPNMDGFTLVRRLRAEPLLMGVPVIFQTANYDVSEIHRLARASGVQHILRKVAEPQEILRAVQAALKQPTIPSGLPQTGQLQREHLQLLADKLYQKVSELEKANDRLRSLSLTDGLTGLNNRRGFMILATGLLKFARRASYSVSLLYIDLDSLKYINDRFGHTGGDTAINHFASILTETFRDSDVIGRMGGDEFVVLIIDASESDVINMQARLQSNVDAHNLKALDGHALAFSLGVIRLDQNSTVTMEELLSQADAAMYKHKQSRRRAAQPRANF
ncbi:MAG: diguanylate cyclase [Anaerolineae bacterium]|nr:diguanylate cyclase [Anaerolineae bacterium]MCI0610082.1 diguanylate cyclase [Anaerolineae bacterium]